jgi:hypothetical protein
MAKITLKKDQYRHLPGVRITYSPEKRPAFRLFVDGVTKKTLTK